MKVFMGGCCNQAEAVGPGQDLSIVTGFLHLRGILISKGRSFKCPHNNMNSGFGCFFTCRKLEHGLIQLHTRESQLVFHFLGLIGLGFELGIFGCHGINLLLGHGRLLKKAAGGQQHCHNKDSSYLLHNHLFLIRFPKYTQNRALVLKKLLTLKETLLVASLASSSQDSLELNPPSPYLYSMNDADMDKLVPAAKEYLWMLDHSYPQSSSLTMVGNKFELPGEFRQVLYRGISASRAAIIRRDKKGGIKPGDRIGVDAYNVLFTVNNYLLGRKVFLCNDGYLRDAGEMRGRIVKQQVFSRSVDLLLETLSDWEGASFRLLLDEPVSHSGELANRLSAGMKDLGITGQADTDPSPDTKLIETEFDVLCTSDSVVIDRFGGRVFDLALYLLEQHFNAHFPDLGDIAGS